MEIYTWMRAFADSWMLLAMTLFFLGMIAWAFRPGSKATHRDAGNIPFRNDTVAVDAPQRGADDQQNTGDAR